jgi:hypothetical protein
MKTLYERLEPSVLEGLKANQHEYEHSVEMIENALKANTSWLELKVLDVHQVLMFSDFPFAKIDSNTFRFGTNIIKDEE